MSYLWGFSAKVKQTGELFPGAGNSFVTFHWRCAMYIHAIVNSILFVTQLHTLLTIMFTSKHNGRKFQCTKKFDHYVPAFLCAYIKHFRV